MRPSLHLHIYNYMSWTNISNIVKNTFLTILILRMYIVDPYYYSNDILTNMLTDVRVSCFSFSIGSINNPISLDSVLKVLPIEKPEKVINCQVMLVHFENYFILHFYQVIKWANHVIKVYSKLLVLSNTVYTDFDVNRPVRLII